MATDTTTQIVQEAPEIQAYKVALMDAAKAAAQGQGALPAYQVAGMSQDQLNAMTAGRGGIGAYAPYLQGGARALTAGTGTLGEAADVLRGADTRNQFAAAQSAYNQAGQGYNPWMAQQFMNPYTFSVLRQSLGEINRQGDIARQGAQAQAVRAGAFGGGREGVQRAELERGLSQTRNQAITSALQQGYGAAQQQAQQAFEQQMQRQLAQGQGIGNLAAQQFGIGQQMAQGLGALGTQIGNLGVQQAALGQTAQQLGQNDVNFLYNMGTQQQKQYQAELDALRASKMQDINQPLQKLAFMSDIYKGAPSTQMAVTQQQQAAPSPFQQIAGIGTGILGTAAAVNAGSKLF